MTMETDPWLDRWLPRIIERCGEQELLEVGCGFGRDTAVLTQAGLRVYGFDLRDVGPAQAAAPAATLERRDMRQFFPTEPNRYPVIIASLTLHYFEWPETVRLVSDIHDALEPDGLFFARLNSTEDVLYGASGYPEIGHHFYQVEERTKRFFDERDLARLFEDGPWKILSQEKMTIGRYDRPKIAWEIVLQK